MKYFNSLILILFISSLHIKYADATFYCDATPGLDVLFGCPDLFPYCCKLDSTGDGYCALSKDQCLFDLAKSAKTTGRL
ncbi:uncharacterized protein UTRI_04005 [Ustilago trichophora]|uniref:Uncharacterized protein n=1 Tax=Ustilago trichophora TaxID=86804 RepID=A0A5C3EA72_9BASI|nr:uncharacterized protein UTRI_04005 [Ustilago trichophora]